MGMMAVSLVVLFMSLLVLFISLSELHADTEHFTPTQPGSHSQILLLHIPCWQKAEQRGREQSSPVQRAVQVQVLFWQTPCPEHPWGHVEISHGAPVHPLKHVHPVLKSHTPC